MGRALDIAPDPGHGEAPFLADLAAVACDDLGVDQDIRAVTVLDVHHEQAA